MDRLVYQKCCVLTTWKFIDFHVNPSLATNGNERFVWVTDSRWIMFLSFESAGWFECRWEGKSKYRTFHFRLCYSETMQLPGLVMETLAELAYFLAWAQNLSMFLILALIHQWNHCCMLRDLKDTRYTRHVQNQGFEQVAATLIYVNSPKHQFWLILGSSTASILKVF